ncbi:M48 family metallopeptidase [Nocardioides sp. ChNu-153]|uniref:M48 family metallopeptidase n=1 Tax=unclassified Nocardioides TaxID=2615069 RepID=UPI002405E573|nr:MULTISPECIES: M48 family metallopeptidase [unclassified Nocardioides]MDF9715919.1 M48 family metallopeptidase [Nocardioides sp. ChNu-99]MDN7122912.1 M48 family metallopeptidase [Nocardioides sp. ChNu-153]
MTETPALRAPARERGSRRTGLVVAAVGAVAFVALAALLVPWHPVPGGVPDPVDPTTVLSAEQVARGEALGAYSRAVSWTSLAVSTLLALWLGLGRRGAALVRRLPGPWCVQVPLGVLALAVIGRLVTLPFGIALWRRRVSEGLSTQGWGDYLRDVATGVGVNVVGTSVVLLVVVACARRWPRAWPGVAAGLAAVLVGLGSFAYPVLVEPLSNDFTPLPAGELRTQIEEVAATEGVPVDDVLVADASRRTTTLNAYVSGLGGTRRVVLYDTAVQALPREALLSVVAHELAHAKNHDVAVGTALGAAGAVVGVGLLAALVGTPALRRRGGASGMADPAVVPLVLALLAVGTVLVAPVQNGISRQVERRADVVALETTDAPEALVALQRELAVRAVADPTPSTWGQFWFGSHPTTMERIAVARGWDRD